MKSFLWIIVISSYLALPVLCDNFIGLLQDLVNLDIKDSSISEVCKSEITEIRNGLHNREIWVLKLLDASSHLGSDFVWGNNIATGAPRSCNLINSPRATYVGPNHIPKSFPNLTQIASPFPVNYRVLHARHHSRMQLDLQMLEKTVLDFAFCMPSSCSRSDSEQIFRHLLSDENFLNKTLLDNSTEFLQTKLLEVSNDFFSSPFVQAFLIISSTVVILIILDIAHKTYKKVILQGSLDSVDLKKSEEGLWERLLGCFSITENIQNLVSPGKKETSIPAIDGLRAISMFFFIVGHVGLFGASSITNFQQILVFSGSIWTQPLFAMHLSVDTFYVISATLLSYAFFEFTKTNEIRNHFLTFVKMFVKRYLRLTPTYAVQICMVVAADKLVKDLSPYYLMDDNEPKCERFWWTNLLYINNFGEVKDMCMMWSYFLASELQLYTIGLIILLVMTAWKRLGVCLYAACFLAAVVTCGYFGYTLPLALTLQSFYATGKYLYTPFWCRLPAYFVGIFSGWFLSYKDCKMGLSKKLIALGWTVACVILLCLEFGHMKPDISPITALFYAAFARFGWAVGISWVIVACTTGHGGFLGRFLSMKFFVPFSRLTYSTYLINPVFILIVTMLNDTPMHIDYGMLPVTTVGFVISGFIAALIFSMLFESPVVRLIKLLRM